MKLPVAEDIPAGRTDPLVLFPGTAHRIMTVAPARRRHRRDPRRSTDGATDTVAIRACARPGQHVRHAGEDVTVGTTVLHAGPGAHARRARAGRRAGARRVERRSATTGSGDVYGLGAGGPGTPLQPGQIYESNAVMLAAAVRDAGGDVTTSSMTDDDVDTFRAALHAEAANADLIITTGGVSAGAYEVVKDTLADEVDFVKVAMQPGMPQGRGNGGGDADHHAARQSRQRPRLVRGIHPRAAAGRDGAAAPRAATPRGHPARGPDLAAREAAVPARRAGPRPADGSGATGG